MISNISGSLKVAPLLLLRIRFLSAKKIADAKKFNLEYDELTQSISLADKLRWHRYHKGLLQKDVAEYLEIDRRTYIHYEAEEKDFYPVEHMEKLAELYGVPVEEFLDEYNLFLHNGQGKQIIAARKNLNMTQQAFADKLGVRLDALKKWEKDRVVMHKSTWEKYFK